MVNSGDLGRAGFHSGTVALKPEKCLLRWRTTGGDHPGSRVSLHRDERRGAGKWITGALSPTRFRQ